MARFIPSNLDPETKSSAEKNLYRLFRQMSGTDDWVIMHSVALADHPSQSQGEADFVVIIPNRGVIVLEVKGGGISYTDGLWYSIDRNSIQYQIKNPQQEANDAMHAIKNHLAINQGIGSKFQFALFTFGVVFPDTEIGNQLTIPDLAREQIADMSDCFNVKRYLLRLIDYAAKKRTASIYLPNRQQCDEIVRLLRPDVTSRITVGTAIRGLDDQILELTQNQQDTFDGLLENERNLVKGSAGTGKTILAKNYAEILAKQGKRVGFFCYNLRLAQDLREKFVDYKNVVCGSFTDYAEKTAKAFYANRIDPAEDRDTYYNKTLPNLLAEACIDGHMEPFDVLILDEAQDLMTDQFLEAMDCLLRGGLRDGNWCFFMDAEKQNLFHATVSEEDVKKLLKEKRIFYANYTLKDNCRNSISIIEKMDAWFGTNTRSHLSFEYGCDVEIRSYKNKLSEAEALSKLIGRLLQDGVNTNDIVVLSPVRRESSCVELVEDYSIADSDRIRKNEIRFCTIQGFKGLESPVIIITDVENVFGSAYLNLLYVGITRARAALYIFASEHAYKKLASGGKLGNED